MNREDRIAARFELTTLRNNSSFCLTCATVGRGAGEHLKNEGFSWASNNETNFFPLVLASSFNLVSRTTATEMFAELTFS